MAGELKAPTRSEQSSKLDVITRDLVTRPDVRSVVIAAGGASGAVVVVSAAGISGRPLQRSHDFVSRAVRAQRQMVES